MEHPAAGLVSLKLKLQNSVQTGFEDDSMKRMNMTISASCRCRQTIFKIAGELPEKLTRCNCSFCSKRGYIYAYYSPEQFHQITGNADGTAYRWQTKMVEHHFCPECGCATFSDSPTFEPDGSWDGTTRRIGVNARLIDDFDAALAPVIVIDGKNLW